MRDRIRLRAVRAWGRFKRAAVSAFAFVEAAGPLYIGKLLRDGLGAGATAAAGAGAAAGPAAAATGSRRPRGILRAMSLTAGFAPAGAGLRPRRRRSPTRPHASALQCGACGGFAGDVNARLLAGLLNDGAVRDGLAAGGIEIPADTRFVAGLHDTVSDEVRLFDDGLPRKPPGARPDRLRAALARAGGDRPDRAGATAARADRAERWPARGRDWSELRPEWGLAGCRGFIAAPRARTAGRDLGGARLPARLRLAAGRAASRSLELILTAPVVVASWIALQYHGSAVAPEVFGAGNKLLHNVVGGIGVLEGNGGDAAGRAAVAVGA